mmetsp:Transcript_15124/g.43012  ORF Transcript_15124/g.43012 Transcript_15124/m.43012 type:complete len:214 (+) Transcript_15124:755-1396(+)
MLVLPSWRPHDFPGAYVHSDIGRRAFRLGQVSVTRPFARRPWLGLVKPSGRRRLPIIMQASCLPLKCGGRPTAGSARPAPSPFWSWSSSSSRLASRASRRRRPLARGTRRRRASSSGAICRTPRARRSRTGAPRAFLEWRLCCLIERFLFSGRPAWVSRATWPSWPTVAATGRPAALRRTRREPPRRGAPRVRPSILSNRRRRPRARRGARRP